METVPIKCDRGGQVDLGSLRFGVMQAEIVDGVPFAQIMAFHEPQDEVCVLERGRPMEFPSGTLVLLDVETGGREPLLTFAYTPTEAPK